MRARPIIVFAHGAGAPSSSAWMQGWARRLGTLGTVVAFDYPYMAAGRRSPDRPPVLVAAHRAAVDAARAAHPGAPLVMAGKSMGGRIGCHVATEVAPAALVCFGYPLRSGSSGTLRDEVLLALRTPILFLQGTRDPLCNLDELTAVRRRMKAPSAVHVVEGGNHSLEAPKGALKKAGRTQEDVDAEILAAVTRFLAGIG